MKGVFYTTHTEEKERDIQKVYQYSILKDSSFKPTGDNSLRVEFNTKESLKNLIDKLGVGVIISYE